MSGMNWNNFEDDDDFGEDNDFQEFKDDGDDDILFDDNEEDDDNEVTESKDKKVSKKDEDERHVVRSEKDKRFEELSKCVKKLRNHMKINDWSSIQTEWSDLEGIRSKSTKVFEKDGYPGFYLSFLVDIKEMIDKSGDKEAKKNMSSKNSKSMVWMKHNFKKFLNRNKKIEEEMKRFRDHPDEFEMEEEDEDKKKKEEAPLEKTTYDFDSDEEFNPKDLSSETDSDDDYTKKPLSYWYEKDEEDLKPVIKPAKPGKHVHPKKPEQTKEGEPVEKKEEPEKKVVWDQERVDKTITELLTQRGSKGYRKTDTINILEFLFRKAKGVPKRVQIGFYLINAYFDATLVDAVHMPFKLWKFAYNMLTLIVNTLLKEKDVKLVESASEMEKYRTELELPSEAALPPNYVQGNLTANLEKLHDELYKALQNTEPYTQKYEQRLKHEPEFLLLGKYIEQYYNSIGKDTTQVCYKLLEHIYYKQKLLPYEEKPNTDVISEKDPSQPEEETSETLQEIIDVTIEETPIRPPDVKLWDVISDGVEQLTKKIYLSGEELMKGKTLLYHIYSLALHNQYFAARDLLLVSHMQEKITQSKVGPNIQVLYNRCIVQLGISAFRKMRFLDSYTYLHDIIFSGKSKELLAQGLNTKIEKTPEEEKKELKRQLPHHMHINIEQIEGILLISSMILEINNLSNYLVSKRKIHNKYFKKEMDRYDRLIYTGPPENVKEKILVSSRYLYEGEWKKCLDLLKVLPIWNMFTEKDELIENLTTIIKQESLKAYIITQGHYFEALNLTNLSNSFDVPKSKVVSIISKMLLNKDIEGALDQVEDCLVMHTEDISLLQKLAFSYAEKINVILEIENYETSGKNKWNDPRQKYYGKGQKSNKSYRGGGRGQPKRTV